jgi:hypothetical protein
MKRRIILSIALALSILLVSLTSSDSTVIAQQPQRYIFDTGLITLDQDLSTELRITVATGVGDDAAVVQFRQMNYAESSCGDGICKYVLASQSQSAPVQINSLNTAEKIASDILKVRVMVLSNSRDVKVNASIVDAVTGSVRDTMEIEYISFN